MCELFALSAKYPTKVKLSLSTFASHGGRSGPHKDGWGVAYYHGDDAWLVKEAQSAADSKTQNFVRETAPESTLILSHIRLATHGEVSLANTQPFSFPLNGQRITFGHNGHVPSILSTGLGQHYQPVGSSDSETVFAMLLHKLHEMSALAEESQEDAFGQLERFLQRLATHGPLNITWSDGTSLFAFSNKRTQGDKTISAPGMHLLCRECSAAEEFVMSGVTIGGNQQHLVMFASVPLSDEHWVPMEPNKLYVAREGSLIHQPSVSSYKR
jgi:glutamine amidotransferase